MPTKARIRIGGPDENSPAMRVLRGEQGVHHGRIPEFVPTDEHRHAAMALAANGATRDVIADILKISTATLDKYFKKDIKKGKAHITGRIGFVVVREALAGNMSAAKYWLDRHGGELWKPPAREPGYMPDDDDNPEEVVQFYLPENGRDRPEDEPPTIDGDVDDLKTGTDA